MSMERPDRSSMERPQRDSNLWANVTSGILVFIATCGLIGALGSQRLAPMDAKLVELTAQIKDINTLMAPLLTLNAQHVSDLAVIDQIKKEIDTKLDRSLFDQEQRNSAVRYDQGKADMIRTLDEVTHQIHDLEGEIVKRSDNDQRQASIDRQISVLENRLNALQLLVENRPSESNGGNFPQPPQIQPLK